MHAIHKVEGNFPILQIIKSISKQVRLYKTIFELSLNERPCQLLRSMFLCHGQENTRNFSCPPLLSAPQAANSHSICKSTAGDAQHRTRQSFSLQRPAPMMFLKNILIDAPIRRNKSKRRSSGASAWRRFCFPGQVYLDVAEHLSWCMACTAARVHCRENIFSNWLQRVTVEKNEMNWCATLLRGQTLLKSLAYLQRIIHVRQLQTLFFI